MATHLQSTQLSSTRIDKIQPASSFCPPSISRRYKTTCVTTKSGLFVLFAVAVITVTGLFFISYFRDVLAGHLFADNQAMFIAVCSSLSLGLFMFLVAGLVGEVCCKRFKTLVLGSVLVAVGITIFLFNPIFTLMGF